VASAHHITLIPGDGIGPEVAEAAVRVLDASGATLVWEREEAGAAVVEQYGTPVPPRLLESIRRTGVALKGPVTTPVGKGFRSANVTLRQELDLYAAVRPVKSLPGVETHWKDIDLIVIRENTEGLYAGLEHQVVPGVVESLKIVTERASTRIARYAFTLAEKQRRRRISSVHKANILKLSDGLFLECARQVAREHPDITYDEIIIDNCAMQLVRDPTRFDVLLLENLYGDIISDLCAGLVGGLGVVAGSNIGDHCGVFEAVHGSAPDIAGRGIANPTALILSGVELLRYLGENTAADRVAGAVHATLSDSKSRTRDLGGTATLDEFTRAVLTHLET